MVRDRRAAVNKWILTLKGTIDLHRFLVPPDLIAGDEAVFPPEEAAHAARVLRLKTGDEVTVLDGRGGVWGGYLTRADARGVTARLVKPLPSSESPVRITLYQGLPKFDKLDFIAQKATELGAVRVVPVAMARSVARLDGKDAEKRRERLQKIACEAAKQAGRAVLPVIETPMSFARALEDMRARDLLIVPWEDARGARLRGVFRENPGARDIGVVIGPEGGMEPEEVAQMNGRAVTLGPRILRAETAAVAAVALVQQLWGDM